MTIDVEIRGNVVELSVYGYRRYRIVFEPSLSWDFSSAKVFKLLKWRRKAYPWFMGVILNGDTAYVIKALPTAFRELAGVVDTLKELGYLSRTKSIVFEKE